MADLPGTPAPLPLSLPLRPPTASGGRWSLPGGVHAVRCIALEVPDAGVLHVLLVADDPLARAALAMRMEGGPGFTVAGHTAADADLETALERFRPHVVLWDLGWNAAAGREVPDLRDVPVPVVLLLPDESLALEAWQAGARALLFREAGSGALLSALTAVQQGLVVLDPALADALLPLREAPGPIEDLTPREREVLQLLAEGLPNKLIADRLGISEHTVKFHVNAILSKLGAHSRTEAVTRAARIGLLLL